MIVLDLCRILVPRNYYDLIGMIKKHLGSAALRTSLRSFIYHISVSFDLATRNRFISLDVVRDIQDCRRKGWNRIVFTIKF